MDITSLKKIVYVEDEDDIRLVGEMALNLANWNIVSCSSGTEALEVAKSEKPDLIILDVMMPVMDGPTTLKKLRQNPQTASIPVLFMTAKVQKTEIDYYISLGAIAVISKPFDPMILAEEIKKIWQTI